MAASDKAIANPWGDLMPFIASCPLEQSDSIFCIFNAKQWRRVFVTGVLGFFSIVRLFFFKER